MKRLISIFLSLLLLSTHAFSFCGFYVAKADTKLFNETSEVIYVRNGLKSTITMSNDFQGNVKDFAMVVPVPVVLKKKDIKTMDRSLFQKFDDYSGPRLVEYHDANPCYVPELRTTSMFFSADNAVMLEMVNEADVDENYFGVTIEAEYQVDEYDILILSATESSGLKDWLVQNNYKIPEGAEEVLDPYIKDDMKFFVVKVNLERLNAISPNNEMNPIQISFESKKFMLPIRLGMANSKGSQDMVVYFLSKKGRIETANYRTAKIPTDRNVPTFVRENFGQFYKGTFDKAWAKEGEDAVMLEYAWDVSSNTAVKCDPCVGAPPLYNDFIQAGVDWFKNLDQEQQRWDGSGGDYGTAFFTRLHVRYDRKSFPQDLLFIETPNRENFQGRYVLTNPAHGNFDCDEGQDYLSELFNRREKELKELYHLADWDNSNYYSYLNSAPLSYDYNKQFYNDKERRGEIMPVAPQSAPPSSGWNWNPSLLMTVLGLVFLFYGMYKLQKPRRKEVEVQG